MTTCTCIDSFYRDSFNKRASYNNLLQEIIKLKHLINAVFEKLRKLKHLKRFN